MRKLVLSLVASAALALSSAANAGITIGSTSGLTSPPVVHNGITQDTVAFEANTEPSGSFTSWLDFTNDSSGIYSLVIGTSTPGASFSSLMLQSSDLSQTFYSYSGPSFTNLLVSLGNLDAGDYRLTFGGDSGSNTSVASGNITFDVQAVPEPATWALMLLGFAGVGFAMRRSRKPALAQLA